MASCSNERDLFKKKYTVLNSELNRYYILIFLLIIKRKTFLQSFIAHSDTSCPK